MKNRNMNVQVVVGDRDGQLELTLVGPIMTERFWALSGGLHEKSLENVEAVAEALTRFVATERGRLGIPVRSGGDTPKTFDPTLG